MSKTGAVKFVVQWPFISLKSVFVFYIGDGIRWFRRVPMPEFTVRQVAQAVPIIAQLTSERLPQARPVKLGWPSDCSPLCAMGSLRKFRFLIIFFTLGLSLASPSTFARNSCEEQLTKVRIAEVSAGERQIAKVLLEMNELKKQRTTQAVLRRLDVLNQEALEVMGAELQKLNIAYKIVDPKTDVENPLSRPARRKRWEQALATAEEQKKNAEEKLAGEAKEPMKELYQKMLHQYEKSIAHFKAELHDLDNPKSPNEDLDIDPLTDSPLAGGLHMLMKPYIRIIESETNPPLVNKIIREYNVEMIISPNFKSLSPDTLAAVAPSERPKFWYPMEEIFGNEFGLNGTLLHELTHLRHAKMRSKGIQLPYYIDLTAKKGEKLHFDREGFYDGFMSFDELSAWNKDLSYTNSKLLGSVRKRSFKDGEVYQQGNLASIQYRIAKGLMTICKSGAEALSALRAQLDRDPNSVRFIVSQSRPSKAIIPYFRWAGTEWKEIGSITVTLVDLKSEKDDKMGILLKYLDLVEARLKVHTANARAMLDSFGDTDPDSPWLKIEN